VYSNNPRTEKKYSGHVVFNFTSRTSTCNEQGVTHDTSASQRKSFPAPFSNTVNKNLILSAIH
jgi:hypothetical protein